MTGWLVWPNKKKKKKKETGFNFAKVLTWTWSPTDGAKAHTSAGWVYNRRFHWRGKHRCVSDSKKKNRLERELRHEVGRFLVVFFSLMLQRTELAVTHPLSPPSRKEPRLIGPPVHSVSTFHTCTNTYKATNSAAYTPTHTHTASHAHPLAHMGLVTSSQNSLPPVTESEGTSLCRKEEMVTVHVIVRVTDEEEQEGSVCMNCPNESVNVCVCVRQGIAAPRSLLSLSLCHSWGQGWVCGQSMGEGWACVCVRECVCPRSVVVLVVVFTLLDAVAVLLLLVLLLRVGDVPLGVVVQHGLGLVDLQLRKHQGHRESWISSSTELEPLRIYLRGLYATWISNSKIKYCKNKYNSFTGLACNSFPLFPTPRQELTPLLFSYCLGCFGSRDNSQDNLHWFGWANYWSH